MGRTKELNYFSSDSFIFSTSLTCAVLWLLLDIATFQSNYFYPHQKDFPPSSLQVIPLSKIMNYLAENRADLWLRSLPWSRSARLKISVTENKRVVELQKLSISLLYLLLWSWKAKKTHGSQQQQKFLGLLKFFLGSKIITAFLSTP